jgi:hypothetical protein
MSTLLVTIAIAFAVIIAALAFMGISWLITGKLSMRPGACGRDPTKKRSDEEGCGSQPDCMLCKKDDEKK